MRKKRVLLLSEGFGSGHTQAAYALAVGIRLSSSDIQTRVIELGNFLNPVVGPLIVSAYRKTVSKQPKLVGLMYRSNYHKSLNRFTQLALHRVFYTRTVQVIDQLKPDIIVCTHPIPNAVVARIKRLSQDDVKLCTVITDYDAHGSWVSQEVNHYLVSTPLVKQKLIDRGVEESRIEVTGIPVHPSFWQTNERSEVLTHFGLKDMPTVLVMGGGWGLMDEEDLFNYMTEWRNKVQIIICAGSNEKMKEKLLQNERFVHPNIHILGFTREVNKLMDVADLLVTKPGGMTCTEGLCKALPMLFYKPIPGQEEENCEYFVQNGFGEMLHHTETIDRWFNRIQDRGSFFEFREKLLKKRNEQYDPRQCTDAVLHFMQ
ncbi:MGDG synthase family glycosyltransferase [Paenibacillus xylaniclasticus]|uniref:MGDG synthase family glycosyltransferase n=1 Tax=Paenibacillus xylaniclasticus TaxID=588083 RepID=UPI000FD7A3D7|nr:MULTISPECIES: glycosyltransferase [Paenibacillus]GFN29875.1 UDP-glucuronosyltransferase [Paenibacillus curdlanolyticus]